MDKDILRKAFLDKRNKLNKEEIKSKSNIIKEKLFSSKEYKKAKSVCFYVSFNSEVFTHDMIKETLKTKEVSVPVVKKDILILSKIDSFKDLDKKNKYGNLEPSKIKEIKKVDLIIVPAIIFDKKRYRIGYGKGYYDRLLKKIKAKTIGLTFSSQIIEKIPIDDFDVKVGKVISDKWKRKTSSNGHLSYSYLH